MKNKKYIGIFFIFIVGAIFLWNQYSVANSNFYSITNERFKEILNNRETKIVYIGRPTCPNCNEFKPIVSRVINKHNIQVYDFNTDDARESNEEKLMQLVEKLQVEQVPTVLYIEEGIVKEWLVGIQTENDFTNWILQKKTNLVSYKL